MVDQTVQGRPDGPPGGPPDGPGPQGPPMGAPPGLDGKVRRAILNLAVPMAIAEITSTLLMVGVVALMGHMGDDALYVRALYLPMMPLFAGVYLAFEISNQVAASMSRGKGRPQDVLPVAVSFIRVWAVLGAIIFVAFLFCAPLFADAFDVPPALRGEFVSFLRWMTLAELSHVGVLLWASSLRGYGNAGAGAVVTISSRVVQFAGVAVLGLGLGLGPNTVPVSIALGSAAGCALGILLMKKNGLWLPGGKGSWRRPEAGANLKKIGIPVAMTQVLMFGCYFGLLAVLGGYGPTVVSAFSSATSLQFLVLMPGVLLGSATAIVLNIQRGAGVTTGLPKVLRGGLELTIVAYVVIAVAVWAGNHLLGDIMSSSTAIASETAVYLGIVAFSFVIQGPVLTSLIVMEQVGAGPLAALLNLIYYAAVVTVSAVVSGALHDPEGVYKTIAYCNLAGVSVVVVAILVVRRLASKPAAPMPMPMPAGP